MYPADDHHVRIIAMLIKNKTDSVYDHNAGLAFRDGHYRRYKVKRHRHQKYDLYHHYLPSCLSPMIKLMKKYFATLDSVHVTLPPEQKYRQTEFELFETALNVLHFIRAHIAINDSVVIGSRHVSPYAWAVFGRNQNQEICKLHFQNMEQLFNHYNKYIALSGIKSFNKVKVPRPYKQKIANDSLFFLVQLYGYNANNILSVSLFLLFDLLRHAGPDCGLLHSLFTNDKSDIDMQYCWDHWIRCRSIVDNDIMLDDYLKHKGGRSLKYAKANYQFSSAYCHVKKYDNNSYYDVEVKDVQNSHILIDGELVQLYSNIRPTVTHQGLINLEEEYNLQDETRMEREIMELDAKFKQMMQC